MIWILVDDICSIPYSGSFIEVPVRSSWKSIEAENMMSIYGRKSANICLGILILKTNTAGAGRECFVFFPSRLECFISVELNCVFEVLLVGCIYYEKKRLYTLHRYDISYTFTFEQMSIGLTDVVMLQKYFYMFYVERNSLF